MASIFFLFFHIITIFVIFPNTTNSISFDFPNFSPNDRRINFQGDSVVAGNTIQLTRNSTGDSLAQSVGRATYTQPIQLWDAPTGRFADFSTHFSFTIIGLKNSTSYGDGITFFLARDGSTDPPSSSDDGGLALFSTSAPENTSESNTVAVEFDTFKNTWDPSADHVGINVNSIVSVANVSLQKNSMKDGRRANAWVTYNATTKNLSVFLTYDNNPVFQEQNPILFHIVDLSKALPKQIMVGFSSSMGSGVEIHKILSWQFNSTFQGDSALPGSVPDYSERRRNFWLGLIIGGGVLSCGLVFAIRLNNKINKANSYQRTNTMDDEFEKGTGPKRFSSRELVYATRNFNEEEKLGQGGFGGVYKGVLGDKSVAVKRISKGSQQGKKEYQSEVKVISQLRHRNLVQLIGWCHERNELLLVYEFMPNRSLDKHLFQGNNYVLNWQFRYKIALGLASVLVYLHEEWEQCVVHRDIKSSNIMLDSDFNAKLGDFGLARFVDHALSCKTTVIAGTKGYIAPECLITAKSSKESDVYSFGIVALEIACGRKPVQSTGELLVDWVWDFYGRGKLLEAADKNLRKQYNESEMEHLMVVGLWCSLPDSKLRPSATQVINVLKFGSSLPNLIPMLPGTSAPYVRHLPSSAGFTNTLVGR
ncbi:hypothetical protein MKX01_007010 [Papaver californicum]|nr:hypothetical protein MKX01_007010 [Papaver californicum]